MVVRIVVVSVDALLGAEPFRFETSHSGPNGDEGTEQRLGNDNNCKDKRLEGFISIQSAMNLRRSRPN